MTHTVLNLHPRISAFTLVHEAFTAQRHRRARFSQCKDLLRLDDRLLRDIGVSRLDIIEGRF